MEEKADGNTNWDETQVSEGVVIRTFHSNNLFEWHRDYEHRKVEVLTIAGKWQFQFDNKLPIELVIGSVLNIPMGQWHRVIPVEEGYLSVKITKL